MIGFKVQIRFQALAQRSGSRVHYPRVVVNLEPSGQYGDKRVHGFTRFKISFDPTFRVVDTTCFHA